MGTKYMIESWMNPVMGYIVVWQGTSKEIADRMMLKSYNSKNRRRLIKVDTEILYSKPAEK